VANGQTIILGTERAAKEAWRVILSAPRGAVLTVSAPRRSIDQNAKLWAMLSDVSRAKPDGRSHTPDVWKALFMSACGHAVQFEPGLDGSPFPIGFRSSRLNKAQMSDLIEFILAWGTERGVEWSDETKGSGQ
jgi:hypothetical protein